MSLRNSNRVASSAVMTVARGLTVLRAFRSNRTPLTNVELVRRTGLPKATVSRLTSTLVQTGFIRRVIGKRDFVLSTAALGIGHSYLSTSSLLNAAQPLMQRLADRLDASVALAVQDGIDMLYVGHCSSQKIATLKLRVGLVLPMDTTAIGRAYLWGLPPQKQEQLLLTYKGLAKQNGDQLIHDIYESFKELDATGTCFVSGGYIKDSYGVALSLRLGTAQVRFAMSCGKTVVQKNLVEERKVIAEELKIVASELQIVLSDLDGKI